MFPSYTHLCALVVLAVVVCTGPAAADVCVGVTCRSPYANYDLALRHPNATGTFDVDDLSLGPRSVRRLAVRDDRDDNDRDDDDRDIDRDNDRDNDRDDDRDHDRDDDGYDDGDDDRDDPDDDNEWTWNTKVMDVKVDADKSVVHKLFELYGEIEIDHDRDRDGDDVPRNVCAVVMKPKQRDNANLRRGDGRCSGVYRDNEIRDMERELRNAVERVHARGLQRSPCAEVTGLEVDVAGDILSPANATRRGRFLLARYLFTDSQNPHRPDDREPYLATLNQTTPIFLLSYPSSKPTRNQTDGDMPDLAETRLTCVWPRAVAEGGQPVPGGSGGSGPGGNGNSGGSNGGGNSSGAVSLVQTQGAKWSLALVGLGWAALWHYF